MKAHLDVVNNDSFIPVKGDIVCGSGEAYGVKLALATDADLSILGVWTKPVSEGRQGEIENGFVEVNCLTLPTIGDKLFLSDTVAGKAVILPPALPFYLGSVIARYRTGNINKALIQFAATVEVAASAGAIDSVARQAAADAQSTADDALNAAEAAVDEVLTRVPSTRTVNGHALSADVTVSKSDVGLGNADNTSDANKPVSTLQQTALNLKADVTDLTLVLDRLGLALSTGVVWGLIPTINASDESTFDLSAGAALVVDHTADPDQPVIYYLNYAGATGIAATEIGVSEITNLMFNRNGALIQTVADLIAETRRDFAVLGWLQHTTGTILEMAKSEPEPVAGAGVSQMIDFLTVFGPMNVSGNVIHANTPSLYLDITAGETFDSGTNYEFDPKNPNIFSSPGYEDVPLLYYHRDASGEWVNEAVTIPAVDPDQYDTGMGLASVPAERFTIQLVFYYAPQGDIDIQYGQAHYASIEEAESHINASIAINPYLTFDTHRAWIIIQQGATSLQDPTTTKIIPAGKWGLISVASGGGTGGEVNTAANINLTGVGLFDRKMGVNLQFRGLIAGSNVVSLDYNAPDKVIEIDVVQTNFQEATQSIAGQMPSADKIKLDNLNLLSGTSETPPDPTGLLEGTFYFRHEV